MSGHSKWATTKHKKAAVDKVRGKLFAKLIRQIEVAAREGGGDLKDNATLRAMYEKARSSSVPSDTIERAIKRGTGELEGVTYESVTYEGYAPCGVAVIVETLTDNRNRTTAEVKNAFTKAGGSLAEPGAVAWQFDRKGVIMIDKAAGIDEDDLILAALEAGAEDVSDLGEAWQVTTVAAELHSVRDALAGAGFAMASADPLLVPSTAVPLGSESEARKVLRVIDALEDHDDVQNVYSNFDISDEILASVMSDA